MFILFDHDLNEVVGSQTYATYEEAVEAIDPRMNNVIVEHIGPSNIDLARDVINTAIDGNEQHQVAAIRRMLGL